MESSAKSKHETELQFDLQLWGEKMGDGGMRYEVFVCESWNFSINPWWGSRRNIFALAVGVGTNYMHSLILYHLVPSSLTSRYIHICTYCTT